MKIALIAFVNEIFKNQCPKKDQRGISFTLRAAIAIIVFIVVFIGVLIDLLGVGVIVVFIGIYINEKINQWIVKSCVNKIYPLRKAENDDFEANCVICLDKFDENAVIRDLSCNHSYQKLYIDNWFKVSRRCPTCRSDAA